MKGLQKKLYSQSGASILLAMLLFFVCAMAAASVLAAAAANAGKARSNRAQQQKYLTLTSAIQLVCDELQKAEYTGKYKIYEWEKITTVTDASNVVRSITKETYFYCEQEEGEYACGVLSGHIPLEDELDKIFAGQFDAKGAGYKPLGSGESPDLTGAPKHTLTITLPDLDGYPSESGPEAYEAEKTVTVQVRLDHTTCHIILTAWLGEESIPPADGSAVSAEMVAEKNMSPIVDYPPAGRKAGDKPPVSGSTTVVSGTEKIKTEVTITKDAEPAEAAPIKWKLNWIGKGVLG